MTAAAQQQQASRARAPYINKPTVETFWTAQQIKDATGSVNTPVETIERSWALIAAEMAARGIWDRENAAGVAGTVAIETAHTFLPVREAFWLSEEWRRLNLRYYPYYGRGYVQLTWASNYGDASEAVGIDLLKDPDLAMEPEIAAKVLAWFWDTHFIPQFARRRDWTTVRARVQGGDSGLDELITSAETLLGIAA